MLYLHTSPLYPHLVSRCSGVFGDLSSVLLDLPGVGFRILGVVDWFVYYLELSLGGAGGIDILVVRT